MLARVPEILLKTNIVIEENKDILAKYRLKFLAMILEIKLQDKKKTKPTQTKQTQTSKAQF